MKVFVIFMVVLVLGINSVFAGDCEVMDYSTYQKVRGSVSGGDGSIYTVWCVQFTIRNTSGGGRFDPIITATPADGKTKTKKVKTSRINSNETYSNAICFGSKPITDLKCSF